MPYETEIIPLLEWLPLALLHWLKVVGLLCALAVVGGFLVATLRRGPVFAAKNTFWAFVQGIRDLVLISPKRVFALAWLAVKESFRRKVLIVVAIFVVLLLLAGWYLDPGSTHPGRLYLSFVLSTTMYLMLLLALFLSSMSLPADVKNRTLHTIVTKPVRASEVVLGRILGFAIVASILLAAIGGVSYVFVVRGLAHTHELTVADLKALPGSEAGQSTAMTGKTSNVQSHRHAVYVAPDGTVRLETANEHTHKATAKKVDGKTVYTLGPQQGMLTARVPIYGEFKFRDRKGADSEEGINTGDEWQYRGYIEGNTLAAAIWTFEDITPERFPKGLPVEMTIEVYRTYKGDTSDPDDIPGIPGVLSLRNPKTGKQVRAKGFVGKEFTIDKQFIPRELEDADGRPVDVFKELVHDGKVEIWLECLERGQFFGAARADLYLRARNAPFETNFVKGYVGIWMQTLLIIAVGVMFSTFLSGPVSLMATSGMLLLGLPTVNKFMYDLAVGNTYGGGPIESLIRLLTQQNQTTELDATLQTTVAQKIDDVLQRGLELFSSVAPDFGDFGFSQSVAYGFDVSGNALLTAAIRAFGFVLPLFIAGYFFLKTREVAR